MNKTIQGMRAVAMLAIFGYHAGMLPNGQFPVTFFFMVSGFGIYMARHSQPDEQLTMRDNLRWMLGKFRYFYAVHLLLLLISIPIRWDELLGLPHLGIRTVLHLTLLQSWAPPLTYGFNGVAWYLSALLFVYPAAFWLVRRVRSARYGMLWAALLAAAHLLINEAFVDGWQVLAQEPYFNPLYRLLEVALGMFAARYLLSEGEKHTGGTLAELAVIVLIAVPYLRFVGQWRGGQPGLYGIPFFLAICVYGQQKGALSRLLCTRPFQWLAQYGFEFYMVHELLIVLIRHRMGPLDLPWRVLAPVSAAIAFAGALAFSVLCQKWLKPRFSKKREVQRV